ncbi:hypothetical protein ED733_002159 [Metarhizium rileyi]|uniref:Pru domain-containing protein n=1 Tax=Metarhizium rileyi (strain RCEF 4871) TaxID=1649241 RepID=A0A5C6GKD3_METRR|nr:hypothetical protein ED733_002159 [Metarhizium rileyi]
MPIAPIITFKAGHCDIEDCSARPIKVIPLPHPGYIYLYSEDDLIHFCWRKRDRSLDEAELDLVMVPTDGSFIPYERNANSEPTAKTNGRIFVLKFASSSQRYFFWMQSKPQSRDGNPSWFSPRDRKIGDIVNRLLQGEEVNVTSEVASVRNVDDRDDDNDQTMEDVDGSRGQHAHHGRGSGGAGPDATGGDVREEGEESREGGADGARAASSSAQDAAAAVRNFLDSLRGQPGLSEGEQRQPDAPYPYLNHLLPTAITIPLIERANLGYIDTLLNHLPASIIVLATGSNAAEGSQQEPSTQTVDAVKASLSLVEKRDLLKKVLRSPQLNQALGILTTALRDGGLPGVADALGIRVQNGGYMHGSGMPLGGDQAVRAFVEGVKTTVLEENQR